MCRNFGIVIAFFVGSTFSYLLATDKIQAAKSRGEVLVFRRGYIPAHMKSKTKDDEEEQAIGEKVMHVTPLGETMNEIETLAAIHRQTKIFHWKDVCYDIKIKGNPRRLLDRVDGWVKPGTLTALMVWFILHIPFGIRVHICFPCRVHPALAKQRFWTFSRIVLQWV
jgi:ATP-binding cassette subfamily G (WHITE) protein 2 (PDR)